MNPWVRRLLLALMDLAVLMAAGVAAIYLSGGEITAAAAMAPMPWSPLGDILLGAALFLVIFTAFGLYRRLWQYASVRDLLAVLAACLVVGVLIIAASSVPPALRLLYWLLATAGLGAVRFGFRAWRELVGRGRSPSARRVLIVGAGEAGMELARELVRHPELGLVPVAFLDDADGKRGQEAYGLRVLGPCRHLGEAARQVGAQKVIIAMPSAPGQTIRAVLAEASAARLPVQILPSLRDRSRGQGLVNQVREVRLEDLLGRPEVKMEMASVKQFLAGRTVLVTGAGGSIGSELCRQVAQLGPAELILLGHGENSLYQIQGELHARFPSLTLHPVLGDIRDAQRLAEVFRRFQPGVVFHAAAHKHVPLMELNPEEAIKNNIIGTYNVAAAADRFGVERFVLISTDKAVNAASVMGATKRVAEQLVQALAATSETAFVTVRFGNVLGSRGSVVPLFQQQIARGGPVTITHPEATRYFMTIPEAARLVIQAAAMGRSGDLFVLDMGDPVRVLDLARDLIQLAGKEPGEEIPIEFIGLRPGEKVTEELFTMDEGITTTRHERIFRARAGLGPGLNLDDTMERFRAMAEGDSPDHEAILALLSECERGGTKTRAAARGVETGD